MCGRRSQLGWEVINDQAMAINFSASFAACLAAGLKVPRQFMYCIAQGRWSSCINVNNSPLWLIMWILLQNKIRYREEIAWDILAVNQVRQKETVATNALFARKLADGYCIINSYVYNHNFRNIYVQFFNKSLVIDVTLLFNVYRKCPLLMKHVLMVKFKSL